jgi:hypothetical protein
MLRHALGIARCALGVQRPGPPDRGAPGHLAALAHPGALSHQYARADPDGERYHTYDDANAGYAHILSSARGSHRHRGAHTA